MFHKVYRIVNLRNGKFYYGRRSSEMMYDNYMGSGIRIKAAIKKYGIECFAREILHTYDTLEEAQQAEQWFLDRWVSHPQCYNMSKASSGGHTGHYDHGWKMSDEQKAKISDSNRGRARPDLKGKKWFDWSGTKFSDTHKQNLSIATKNNPKMATKLTITCPYCNKEGNVPNMKRWHMNNCKDKK